MTSARASEQLSIRVRELAEAGASGVVLTRMEIKEVCEALRSKNHSVRNQFHSGN